MRVWILENTPDCEQSTRTGVYVSPSRAWDDLLSEIDQHVFKQVGEFKVMVLSEDRTTDKEKADVILRVEYYSNDAVTLTGTYVEGTGDPEPTAGEWLDFEHTANLLLRHAVEVAHFDQVAEYQTLGRAAGAWKLAKADDAW